MTKTVKITIPKADFLYLAKFINVKSSSLAMRGVYFGANRDAVGTDGHALAILERAWWYVDDEGHAVRDPDQPATDEWTSAGNTPTVNTDPMPSGGVVVALDDKATMPRIKNMPGDKLAITLCRDETGGRSAVIQSCDGATLKVIVDLWDEGNDGATFGGSYFDYKKVIPTGPANMDDASAAVGLNPELLSRFAADKKDLLQIETFGPRAAMIVKSAAYKDRMTGLLMPVSPRAFE